MALPEGMKGLRFACECVSAQRESYSDPWASISQNKLLPNGTKEEILNLVALEPKTISQLAEALDLSPPSVHTHINEMMKSELLRESDEWEKKYPTERYYEPNFPIITAKESAQFEPICKEMSMRVADLFEKRRPQLERAFNKSGIAERGWMFSDISQYLYAAIQRSARELLEERGVVAPREEHKNGVRWTFWAEAPKTDGDGKQSL